MNGLPVAPPFPDADDLVYDRATNKLYARDDDGYYVEVNPHPAMPTAPVVPKMLRGYFFVGTGAGGVVEVTNLQIQRNTLGAVPTLVRNGVGEYRINLGVALPAAVGAYGGWCGDGGLLYIEPAWAGGTYLSLSVREAGSAAPREIKPSAIHFWVMA